MPSRLVRLRVLNCVLVTTLASCHSSTGPTAGPTHPQGVVFALTSLNGEPYGVAISSGGAVLVARVLGGLVTRFDLPDAATFRNVQSGLQPVHVAINPDGTRAYVINQAGQGVRVINLVTNAVIDSLSLTNDGFNIIVAPNGQQVFVTTSDGRVYVINSSSNAIVDSMRVGSAANGLAFNPSGDRLYISSRDAGTVTVFNAQTHTIVGTIVVGGAPQRLAMSPDGATLYVANEAEGVDVVNLPAGTLGPTIRLDGSGYGLGISPDGQRLYATNPLSGNLFIINTAGGDLLSTLAIGGNPRNVAFDRDGGTAVVTDGAGRVIFIH